MIMGVTAMLTMSMMALILTIVNMTTLHVCQDVRMLAMNLRQHDHDDSTMLTLCVAVMVAIMMVYRKALLSQSQYRCIGYRISFVGFGQRRAKNSLKLKQTSFYRYYQNISY